MSSHLPTDEALEKEDRIDEIKKQYKINSPPVPHLLQAQQAPALPYAKVVGRPGTGSYPAPSPDPIVTDIIFIIWDEANWVRLRSKFFSSIAIKLISLDEKHKLCRFI